MFTNDTEKSKTYQAANVASAVCDRFGRINRIRVNLGLGEGSEARTDLRSSFIDLRSRFTDQGSCKGPSPLFHQTGDLAQEQTVVEQQDVNLIKGSR